MSDVLEKVSVLPPQRGKEKISFAVSWGGEKKIAKKKLPGKQVGQAHKNVQKAQREKFLSGLILRGGRKLRNYRENMFMVELRNFTQSQSFQNRNKKKHQELPSAVFYLLRRALESATDTDGCC